jgi:hypothetical protein
MAPTNRSTSSAETMGRRWRAISGSRVPRQCPGTSAGLVRLGLTTQQTADRLVISAKTADHHVQHIYTKTGVSTRGAAALFAIEHGILAAEA